MLDGHIRHILTSNCHCRHKAGPPLPVNPIQKTETTLLGLFSETQYIKTSTT